MSALRALWRGLELEVLKERVEVWERSITQGALDDQPK